jgi:eukaryotic-like serine/threonine-protein kinase
MRAGDLITPNLRLERALGEGGMGMVWVGKNLALESEVAIKFITGEYAENEEARARFKREASMAARVKSPHIVQVFDHGVSADGSAYIVMELLQGEELAMRLDREVHLAPAVVVSIIHQAAKGLARAHQAGIVHRDIKPSNIFLVDNDDGEIFVKIVDFGIAKLDESIAPSSMTATGTHMGTPFYMSPEQVTSAKSADLRTDLWSLAIVAYECLTGERPFSGETLGALWIAINNAEFEAASSLRPSLPRSVDAWFARALAKARQERYQSAREFSDALLLALPVVVPTKKNAEDATGQFPLVSVAPDAMDEAPSNVLGTFESTLAGGKASVPKAPILPSGVEASEEFWSPGSLQAVPVAVPAATLDPTPSSLRTSKRPLFIVAGLGVLGAAGVAGVLASAATSAPPVPSVSDRPPVTLSSAGASVTAASAPALTLADPMRSATAASASPTSTATNGVKTGVGLKPVGTATASTKKGKDRGF